MSLCSNCKAEYIKGKRICSFCGEELYRGLLTDLSDDEKIFEQIEWTKITNVDSEDDAEIILKQLISFNIPAIRKNGEIPFEELGAMSPNNIDIYVPKGLENKAVQVIN